MELDFQSYLLVSSFIVVLVGFIIKIFQNSGEVYFIDTVIRISIISIMILILGIYLSFLFNASIGQSDKIINLAAMSGFKIGSMAASLTGLFSIFFIFIEKYSPSKKKGNASDYIG